MIGGTRVGIARTSQPWAGSSGPQLITMRYLLGLARGAAVVMITSGINKKTVGATDRSNELIQATSEQIDLGHAELARAFWPRPNKFRRGEASGYAANDASNEGSAA